MTYIGCKEGLDCGVAETQPICCYYCEEKTKCSRKCNNINALCVSQLVFNSLKEWKEKSVVECSNCGEMFGKEEIKEGLDGDKYCQDCYSDIFTECDHCGEVIYGDDAYSADDGEGTYCSDCYHEIYTTCDNCGEDVDNEYIHETTGGNWLCESCAGDLYSCDDCGIVIEEGDETLTEEGNRYCENCAESHTYTCHRCEDIHEEGGGHLHNGERYCDSCYNIVRGESS